MVAAVVDCRVVGTGGVVGGNLVVGTVTTGPPVS